MGLIDLRLADLGIELRDESAPVANYVPVVLYGEWALVSGQLPRKDGGIVAGKVGQDLDVDAGREAARLCAHSVLAALRRALGGDLDRVSRCLQLSGFVNSAPDFTAHSSVVNGASDVMVDVFGETGRHARAAVGVPSLPFNAAVEITAMFAISST